jgi:hypothetical protein
MNFMSTALKKSSWTSKKNADLASYRFMPDIHAGAALISIHSELITTLSGQTMSVTPVNN